MIATRRRKFFGVAFHIFSRLWRVAGKTNPGWKNPVELPYWEGEHFCADNVFLLSRWIMAENKPGLKTGCWVFPLRLAGILRRQNVFTGCATAE
jgi:hypothetical protein